MTRFPGGKGWLLAASVAVVVVTLGVAISLMQSPTEARQRRIDQRRMTDLRAIASALSLHLQRHEELPANLDPIAEEYGVDDRLRDPETGEAYGYSLLADDRIELCATFTTEEPPAGDGWRRDEDFWSHPSGHHCFELKPEGADP